MKITHSRFMKKLRISANVTAILAFLSVVALIFLLPALTDIADNNEDLVLEWYISGICLIILAAFTISTIITLGYLIKTAEIRRSARAT